MDMSMTRRVTHAEQALARGSLLLIGLGGGSLVGEAWRSDVNGTRGDSHKSARSGERAAGDNPVNHLDRGAGTQGRNRS